MTFNYEKSNRYFALIAEGMEELGTQELETLGATDIKTGFRGIYFSAEPSALYRINYLSRLLTRILAPLMDFDCHSSNYLYKTAMNIPWTDLLGIEDTFRISANVSRSNITHSQYAALLIKDAIADTFMQKYDKRPNVERIDPDVCFHLHLDNNHATIYLDTSGGSLHRRGYRKISIKAPIQETLAAAIIQMSEWDGSHPLYDPMCGSGTLLAEAAMHYCQIPSGLFRKKYGLFFLPDFDQELWKATRAKADKEIRGLEKGLINGSDLSGEAIHAARSNLEAIPGAISIGLKKTRFKDISGLNNHTIVCNPPYGKRMGNADDTKALIKDLGDFLKQHCSGSQAYIFFGNRELIKSVGLRPSWKKPLKNGPLDGRLVKFDLY